MKSRFMTENFLCDLVIYDDEAIARENQYGRISSGTENPNTILKAVSSKPPMEKTLSVHSIMMNS